MNPFDTLDYMFNSPFGVHKKIFIALGIAVFVLAALGLAMWNIRKPRLVPPSSSALPAPAALPPLATTAPAVPPSLSETLPYQGEPVHIMEADPEVLKQIPIETYQKSKSELVNLALRLAENPRRYDDWMRVAFIKRFYHDYAGARDAYEYLNRINDSDPVPFYNLGALYGYYLKEPQKAVAKYQAAIKRDQFNTGFYIGFADFYREVMADLPSAEKILFDGLAKVPSDVNFMIALGGLYRTMDNIPKAVEYYEKALAAGTLESGQRAAISAELERLKAAISQPQE